LRQKLSKERLDKTLLHNDRGPLAPPETMFHDDAAAAAVDGLTKG
jgi:hypothetical protein